MTSHERRIEQLTGKMVRLGLMLPGSISEQWNVCGTPKCRCKDPEQPVKHGPYYQLSFTAGGKSSTMFIKKQDLPEAQRRLTRYRQFKQLSTELLQAHIVLARNSGLTRRST